MVDIYHCNDENRSSFKIAKRHNNWLITTAIYLMDGEDEYPCYLMCKSCGFIQWPIMEDKIGLKETHSTKCKIKSRVPKKFLTLIKFTSSGQKE